MNDPIEGLEERAVATLDIPQVLALVVEESYMKTKYRDDYVDAKRYVAMEGLPHVIWSFSVTQALSENYPGNFEITTVALCKGNYWFAVSAWDQSSLTGMTLLWKLHLDISPRKLSTSDGSLTTFFSDARGDQLAPGHFPCPGHAVFASEKSADQRLRERRSQLLATSADP
eukprot:s5120_g1.t1